MEKLYKTTIFKIFDFVNVTAVVFNVGLGKILVGHRNLRHYEPILLEKHKEATSKSVRRRPVF